MPERRPPTLGAAPAGFGLAARGLVALAVLTGAGAGAAQESRPGAPSQTSGSTATDPTVQQRLFDGHRAELQRRIGKPEAIAPLAAIVALDDDLPPGLVPGVLRAVVEDRRTHPLVAAQAAYQLALAELRGGDQAAARRRLAGLGLVDADAFRVVGPFDAQGRSGLARVYPPEQPGGGPEGGKRFPGKEREIGWRAATGAQRDGALALDALLRPDADAVAYALTFVRSDRRRTAVLRVGSAGPVRVWVGGRPVLDRNVVRFPGLDQDAARITLAPGETPILIKTVITAGPWRLFVRLTDEAGRPLTDVEARSTGRSAGGTLAGGAPARSREPESLERTLLRWAERAKGPARADAWLDHARLLTLTRAADRDAKTTEASLDRAIAAGAGAEALLLLGEVAVEEEDRRRALERAAAMKDDQGLRALALAGLGELARLHRRDEAATAAFRQALAADPACVPAVLALAAEEQLAGLNAAALARLSGLPAAVQTAPRVQAARARVLESLGRRAEAESTLRALWQHRQTDLEVGMDLARAARNRGAADEALGYYERLVPARPELTFLTVEWARLLEGRQDVRGARTVLEAAAARLLDEPTLQEELGKLLVRAGDVPAGLERLRAALVLRPQNPTLRRFVDRLASERDGNRAGAAEDLARRFGEDGEALAREALVGPGAARLAKETAGAVVLLDKQVVRVHRNGLSERFAQRLVVLRTEQAAREQQEFLVRYTPGTQEVEIRKAQVWRRGEDGVLEVSEAAARDDRDLSEPWYGLYYDTRAEVVAFEGLRPGDVLEVQYTLADVSSENTLADYFGDLDYVAETSPRRRWEYILLGPAERTFHFNAPAVANLERTKGAHAGEVVHRFVARDVPRVELEPSMPGFAEVTPYLHVSTYRGWEDVGRWYWHLIQDQLTPDDGLRRAAREAIGNATSVRDKVRALHAFVLQNTRYVGLEFGIHGYKPYRVTQVLQRRFGDCKDKASLLHVLLKEVGVDSELVLLRTRRAGRIGESPASLAAFDHAIAYVPGLDLYLDGTAEFSGMGELPYEDQGVMALRVSARGATLVETPVLPSSTNRAHRTWSAVVEAGGGGRIEETVTIAGQAAPEWREHYQTPGERRERYTKVWNGRFPGAALEAVDMAGIDDRNLPVTVKSAVRVPRLAEPVGASGLRLPVAARETDLVRSYARLSRRRHELLVAYPWQHEEDLVFRLPEGWHAATLPESRQEETAFGTFRFQAQVEDGGRAVRVRSRIDVTRNRFAPDQYASFRAFLRAIDAALGQQIVLRRDE